MNAAAQAQLWKPRNGVSLNRKDTDLLDAAVRRALEEKRPAATATWSDSETRLGGRVTVLRVFSQDGAPCGEAEHVFTEGAGKTYRLPFCKQANGRWMIVPSGKPSP